MKAKSTKGRRKKKVEKPYPEFPLTPHPTGRWCKRVGGVLYYFGPIDNPQGALERWNREAPYLRAGRTPPANPDALTARDLVNAYLTSRQNKMQAGELKPKTWADYHACCERIVTAFGKRRPVTDLTAQDFAALRVQLAKTRGPIALGNEVQRVRSVFKYGYEAGLIDKPVRFGPDFTKPSSKTIRLAKAKRPARLFARTEIHAILDAAGVKLRAMVLLGVNCGWGNTDVSEVPIAAFNLEAGIVDFARPKTGIPRRATLWAETVQAIRAVLAERREPRAETNKGLFVTKYGRAFVTGKATDGVGGEFHKVLVALGLHRPGRGFYSLRHVFRTQADAVPDRPAIDRIMGHEDAKYMGTHYTDAIDDARLRAVTDHVKRWLFPPSPDAAAVSGVQSGDG